MLNELLVVHGSRFANQMIIVDDFPEDSVFDTMRTTLSRIKRLGSMGKIILGREIQYFLKIDKRNVTGLNALKLNVLKITSLFNKILDFTRFNYS